MKYNKLIGAIFQMFAVGTAAVGYTGIPLPKGVSLAAAIAAAIAGVKAFNVNPDGTPATSRYEPQ